MKSDLTHNTINNKYRIDEKIAQSSFSAVYRATDLETNGQVAFKMLAGSANRPENFFRLRTEADVLARMDNPHIVKILDAGSFDGGLSASSTYLVMEFIDGKSIGELICDTNLKFGLKSGLKSGLKPDQCVSVVSQICSALEAVHEKRVIHGDLKPGNILVTGQNNLHVKVVDFGLSRIKDIDTLDKEEDIRGTFQYMSPEQIGLIRRKVDERSDLYSLGIIFHQLLTGNHPFNTNTLSTLLHEQIARQPEAPSLTNPEIAPVLDSIVRKLLEKDPENRYQSAAGLRTDLERFLSGDKDFYAGEQDVTSAIHLSSRIIGRNRELKQLKKHLTLSQQGNGAQYFIAGEPGVGKTRVLEEFRRHAMSQGVRVVEGRCIERDNKIPWGLFKDGLSEYLKGFQLYETSHKENISETVTHTCGKLGRIILQIHPAAEEILGQCPEVAKLDPEKEMVRSCLLMANFVYTIAQAESGLVIILDDLQWSDTGSLKLLEEIARSISDKPLLMVGADRSNEVKEGHPLHDIIYQKETQDADNQIKIDPFESQQMTAFISEILNTKEAWIDQLSTFILNRSQGNPFYALELLNHLLVEKVLFRDNVEWSIDIKHLEEIKIPETLIDILLSRIAKLEKSAIQVLCNAAVMGKRFNTDLMMRLEKGDTDERLQKITTVLDDAMELQLIEQSLLKKGEMAFVHDRVREAFYQSMPEPERKTAHEIIGHTIEDKYSDTISDMLFDLAYHFIASENEEKILEYAYPAARKANEAHDYDDAIKYFIAIQAVLEKQGDSQKKAWIDCTQEIAVTYLNAHHNDVALELLTMLLPHMETRMEKAAIYLYVASAHVNNSNFRTSEKPAKQGLNQLNERLPTGKIGVALGTVKELYVHLLLQFFPSVFIKKCTGESLEKERMKISFYAILFWTYHVNDFWKVPRVIIRMCNISESRIGDSKELSLSLAYYAMLCAAMRLYKRAFAVVHRAYAMSKILKDEWLIAKNCNAFNFLTITTGNYKNCIEWTKKAYSFFSTTREMNELQTALQGLYLGYYEIADFDNALRICEECSELAKTSSDELMFSTVSNPAPIHINLGDFDNAEKSLAKHLQPQKMKEFNFSRCLLNIYQTSLNIAKQDPQTALTYLKKAMDLDKNNDFVPLRVNIIYNYYPEVLLMDFTTQKNTLSKKQQHRQLKKIKSLCKKALRKNKHFPMDYGGALKINAEFHAATNKPDKADKFFQKAITHHEKYQQPYKRARVHYAYGLFLKNTEQQDAASSQLELAHSLFDRIHVPYWKQKTEKALGIKPEDKSPATGLIDKKRTESVLAFGKAVHTCHNFDELSDMVIAKAMEITGAQAGGIFLSKEDFSTIFLKTWSSTSSDLPPEYSQTIVDTVFNSGKPVITIDAEKDAAYAKQASVTRHKLKSILCVPVKYNELINGVCYLHNPLSTGVFSDEDTKLLSQFLSQAAIAIENAILNEKLSQLDAPKPVSQKIPSEDTRIKKALEYIEKNFTDEISRDDLAKLCDVSPGYLGKMFKTHTGKNIRDYLNDLRIKYTVDQLMDTDKKIIDIAFDAGFESLRTFNRIFFRTMGDTPSKYREKEN